MANRLVVLRDDAVQIGHFQNLWDAFGGISTGSNRHAMHDHLDGEVFRDVCVDHT